MDHSHMDHSHMGHGGMDHGDMDMGKCDMRMLFTWSSKNLCIIFEQWRVTGIFTLLMSLIAIVLLTAGYEGVREITRRYEQSHIAQMAAFSTSASNDNSESLGSSSPLVVGRDTKESMERRAKLIKAGLYAVQVFYSFFIMLLFMTYNGWVMLAVAAGAFVGYIAFSADSPATKTVACH